MGFLDTLRASPQPQQSTSRMMTFSDGSILLSPGEPLPAGYQAVGTGANGGTIALPSTQGGSSQPGASSGSSALSGISGAATSLAGKYVYDNTLGASPSSLPAPTPTPAINIGPAQTSGTLVPELPGVSPSGTPVPFDTPGSGLDTKPFLGGGSATPGMEVVGSEVPAASGLETPNLLSASRVPPAATGAEAAFATYGIPAVVALNAAGMAKSASDVMAGKGPGTAGDLTWGTNPVTAWGYWPAKAFGLLGGGLNKSEQVQQDVRTQADKVGLFSRPNGAKQSMMSLADGTFYNVESGKAHNVDQNQKFGQQAVLWSDALSTVVTGGGGPDNEASAALTGYLANGALSNAQTIEGVRANILQQAYNLGLDKDTWLNKLTELKNSGQLDQQAYDVFTNNVTTLFSGDAQNYSLMTQGEAMQYLVGQGVLPDPAQATAAQPSATPQAAQGTPAPVDQNSAVLDAIRQAQDLEARG